MTNFIWTYSEDILVVILILLMCAFAGITTYNIIDYFFKEEEDENDLQEH